jgi:hypothetical protein
VLRVACCGLRVTGCGLRVAGYEIRGAGYALRGAGCGVRGAGCAVRGACWGVTVEGCGYLSIAHRAQSRAYGVHGKISWHRAIDGGLQISDCGVRGARRGVRDTERCKV